MSTPEATPKVSRGPPAWVVIVAVLIGVFGLLPLAGAIGLVVLARHTKETIDAADEAREKEAELVSATYREVADALEAVPPDVVGLVARVEAKLGPSPRGQRLDVVCFARAAVAGRTAVEPAIVARAAEVGLRHAEDVATKALVSARITEYEATRDAARKAVLEIDAALGEHAACLARGERDPTTHEAWRRMSRGERERFTAVQATSERALAYLEVLRRSKYTVKGDRLAFVREVDAAALDAANEAFAAAIAAENAVHAKLEPPDAGP